MYYRLKIMQRYDKSNHNIWIEFFMILFNSFILVHYNWLVFVQVLSNVDGLGFWFWDLCHVENIQIDICKILNFDVKHDCF